MILIIDNKSHFIKKFRKALDERGIQHVTYKHNDTLDITKLKDIEGIVLSGGEGGIQDKSHSADFVAVRNFSVPIIGFCLGHELIAAAFGGIVEELPERQNKMQKIIIDKPDDKIFKGLGKKIELRAKHYSHVTKLPDDFEILAHSEVCPIEIMRHKQKQIYGFQGHPEVSGEDGRILLSNFLEMCGIKY